MKRGAELPPFGFTCFYLLHLVAPLEALYPPCGVHDAPLPCKEWMTLATKLDLQHRLGGAGGKGVAAGANHLRFLVFGMDVFLHITLTELAQDSSHHRFVAAI